MFRCDHCHTEYGGIRGITSGTCPRCRQIQRSSSEDRGSLASAWQPPQLSGARWAALASPLLGPIAELDRAARF